jgi:acetolactate synthase-1/3 small subunit
MQLAEIFRARIIDVAPTSLVIEVVGTPDKIDALLEQYNAFGILELARTGSVGLFRGGKTLKV